MTKLLTALSASLILLAPALASAAPRVDADKSVITWKGSKVTGDEHHGRIFPKSSEVVFVDGSLAKGEIILDLATFTVTDLKGEWADKFLGHMKSADFFDVAKHPTATFKLHAVKGGQASGELTIKGVTKPITFPLAKREGRYVGKATFDRTQFGMTYGSSSFFKNLGDKVINDKVEVEFDIAIQGQ